MFMSQEMISQDQKINKITVAGCNRGAYRHLFLSNLSFLTKKMWNACSFSSPENVQEKKYMHGKQKGTKNKSRNLTASSAYKVSVLDEPLATV